MILLEAPEKAEAVVLTCAHTSSLNGSHCPKHLTRLNSWNPHSKPTTSGLLLSLCYGAGD